MTNSTPNVFQTLEEFFQGVLRYIKVDAPDGVYSYSDRSAVALVNDVSIFAPCVAYHKMSPSGDLIKAIKTVSRIAKTTRLEKLEEYRSLSLVNPEEQFGIFSFAAPPTSEAWLFVYNNKTNKVDINLLVPQVDIGRFSLTAPILLAHVLAHQHGQQCRVGKLQIRWDLLVCKDHRLVSSNHLSSSMKEPGVISSRSADEWLQQCHLLADRQDGIGVNDQFFRTVYRPLLASQECLDRNDRTNSLNRASECGSPSWRTAQTQWINTYYERPSF